MLLTDCCYVYFYTASSNLLCSHLECNLRDYFHASKIIYVDCEYLSTKMSTDVLRKHTNLFATLKLQFSLIRLSLQTQLPFTLTSVK